MKLAQFFNGCYMLALICCIVVGLVQPNQYLWNVAAFITWVLFVTLIISKIPNQEVTDIILKSYRDGRHLPAWADGIFYAVTIFALSAYGRFWYAFMMLIVCSLDFNWRQKAKEESQ